MQRRDLRKQRMEDRANGTEYIPLHINVIGQKAADELRILERKLQSPKQ